MSWCPFRLQILRIKLRQSGVHGQVTELVANPADGTSNDLLERVVSIKQKARQLLSSFFNGRLFRDIRRQKLRMLAIMFATLY
ncbi:MAG: hypothetical protein WKF77_03865 [Planctomycetaceae bacterium]